MKHIVVALLLLSGFVLALSQDKESIRDKRRVDSALIDSKTHELRCQGGPLVFKKLSERTTSPGDVIVAFSMSFAGLTDRPAGANSSGLSAGRCGWTDRPMDKSDNLILFETPANAQSVTEYMKDPNHYWSFFGDFSGPLNYFRVSHHQAWTRLYDMKRPNMDIFRKP